MNKFLQMTAYFMELATPHTATLHTEEAIKLVDKVGGIEWLIQKYEIDGATAIKLDLSLDTPIIVIPRNSLSKELVCAFFNYYSSLAKFCICILIILFHGPYNMYRMVCYLIGLHAFFIGILGCGKYVERTLGKLLFINIFIISFNLVVAAAVSCNLILAIYK